MYNRLERCLNQSHIISEVQYGFRKKYSTYMALINLIDKISSGTESNSFNIGIFIDLSKAFDTIDNNILFQKLNCYGIRGHILTWLPRAQDTICPLQQCKFKSQDSDVWCATRLYTRATIIYTFHQRPLRHFNYYEVHSFCR